MDKGINKIILLLKEEMGLLLSISFGVFLFILFFQPFTIQVFDFNNRLLYVGGFGAIVFLTMALSKISFHWIINHYENLFPSYLSSLITWALPTVAFAFYLRFVGGVSITFFIVFKMVLICLAPTAILRIHTYLKETKAENLLLKQELNNYNKPLLTKNKEEEKPTVQFLSENHAERLLLDLSHLLYIKSANNYVEFVYLHNEKIKRKLLRNTLKNYRTATAAFF